MEQLDIFQATLDLLRQVRDRRKSERDKTKLAHDKAERKYEAAVGACTSLARFLEKPEEEETAERVGASHGETYADMGLTAAITFALNSSPEGLSAAAVRGALLEGGYPNRNAKSLYASVYSTLDRLRKRGLVTKDSEGRWKNATEPDVTSQPLPNDPGQHHVLPASAARVLADVLTEAGNQE